MSDTKRPVLFLIAGAWHGSWMFDSVNMTLTEAGYTTSLIELPSTGEPDGLPQGERDDAEYIRSRILEEINKGGDVAIVCHSYAGVPTCDAVKGLGIGERQQNQQAGGVCSLIFVAAFVLWSGTSVNELNDKHQHAEFHYQEGLVWPARPENLFYNDLPNGFAVELSRLLRSHSAGVFASPLDHEAYRFIPSSYLICTEDNAIPLAAQEEMLADKQGYFLLVERLASGHLPFISRPQETVDFITKTLSLVLTKPAPSQLGTSS
ncbi:hypothetical protein PGT21_028034 [Puccinia graminis f. sp. tritici]|uniref:AB hydrolase-1 domain-containing protein n=1 Tax=Puccinia graminis f. sp. tritici TaxID=56615 RepID=A0A5B0M056_PUCGR|nr:hypothetical protein PGT21_028034 [Puccinia graminis f. sp. tritici]